MNFNQNAAAEGVEGENGGSWSSFKARWVWIILKMGQEEEVEKGGGGGERSSSIKSSPLFASSVYLSCGRGLML